MAFFKFRLPGNSSAAAAEAHVTHSVDSVEVVRRRARHRLIGSVVLVFVAVVAFPLLFDSQPRPVAVDTPILIPDRQATPPLVSGTAIAPIQAPAKPLLPAASTPVPTLASLESGKEEVVAPAKPPVVAASEPADKPAAAPAQVPASKASQPLASAKTAEAKTETKDKPAVKSADDGQKAKALLEGKGASADHAGKVVIQVGAFSDADKVREVRRKLEQAGLKTYTQNIEGKDGKRTTRIRVGPFESRAEADKAVARLRKLDLPAHLISL
jgi:DedD protein